MVSSVVVEAELAAVVVVSKDRGSGLCGVCVREAEKRHCLLANLWREGKWNRTVVSSFLIARWKRNAGKGRLLLVLVVGGKKIRVRERVKVNELIL